jgi:hypothetical protein
MGRIGLHFIVRGKNGNMLMQMNPRIANAAQRAVNVKDSQL